VLRGREAAPINLKAGQLGRVAWCQGGGDDGDVDGGLVGGAVEFAAGVVPGRGAFDDAGADAEAAGGHECRQDEAADFSGQVDDGAGDHAGGEDDLVAGGGQGDGEAGPVGVGVGVGAGDGRSGRPATGSA